MKTLAYLLSRLSEPSSYAGLGALLALFGWHFSDSLLGETAQFLAAGCALLALVLRERGLIPALLLVFLLMPALSACGGLVAAGSAAGAAGAILTAANQISGGVDSAIKTACAEYQKGKAAADAVVATGLVPSAVSGKVSSIESFGDAACANPPDGDPLSTAIWLGQLAGQVTTLVGTIKAGG